MKNPVHWFIITVKYNIATIFSMFKYRINGFILKRLLKELNFTD